VTARRTDENVMWLMKRAFHRQRRALDEAVRPEGVTAAQAGVLTRLAQLPGLSAAGLARELLISPQAAQIALASLERRGLVERRPDPTNGRILRAYLSPEGLRLSRLCSRVALELQAKLLAAFSAAERAQLVQFLERLIADAPVSDDGYDELD
jgi:DNA-binding MarR family transcriptional regulator